MENNNKSKILVTDSYKVEHKKFVEKLMFNSFYPPTSAPYIFNWDATEAEEIAKEGMRIAERLRNTGGLVVVGGAGKPHLHHELPTAMPPIGFIHDFLEDQIGDYPKLSEKIIKENLQLSNIIVSLQSNNQKD